MKHLITKFEWMLSLLPVGVSFWYIEYLDYAEWKIKSSDHVVDVKNCWFIRNVFGFTLSNLLKVYETAKGNINNL